MPGSKGYHSLADALAQSGITQEDLDALDLEPRRCCGRIPKNNPGNNAECKYKHCTELRCECGVTMCSWGPVECPCTDEDEW